MQVAQYLLGGVAHGAMAYPGEQGVAQLVEGRAGQAQRTVGEEQCHWHDDGGCRRCRLEVVDDRLQGQRDADGGQFSQQQAGEGGQGPEVISFAFGQGGVGSVHGPLRLDGRNACEVIYLLDNKYP